MQFFTLYFNSNGLSPSGGGRGREKQNAILKNNILKFNSKDCPPPEGAGGGKKQNKI
jgi:hypothetical protein